MLGALVPAGDHPFGVLRDEGVVRVCDDGAKASVLLLGAPVLRDVLARAGHAERGALIVKDDRSLSVQDQHLAVRTDDPMVELERLPARVGARDGLLHGGAVLGMNPLEEALVARLELVRGAPVQAVELIRPGHLVRRDVPFPGPEAGDLLRPDEAGLAAAQRLLRALPLGDVAQDPGEEGLSVELEGGE